MSLALSNALRSMEGAFNKKYSDEQVQAFHTAFGKKSPDIITKAAQKLIVTWVDLFSLPLPGNFAEVCAEIEKQQPDVVDNSAYREQQAREQRERWIAANEKAKVWLSTSPLAEQAKQEGWLKLGALGGLESWIKRICHAQVNGFSIMTIDLCPEHLLYPKDTDGARGRRQQVAEIIRSDEISVPVWLIDAWRAMATNRKTQVNG